MVNFKFDLITNVSAISTAAILGVLTRTSINLLFGPTRAGILSVDDVLFVDLAANVLGCFVLGCYTILKEQVDIPGALSLAVATGYAGSVTSTLMFSSSFVHKCDAAYRLTSIIPNQKGIRSTAPFPDAFLSTMFVLFDFLNSVCLMELSDRADAGRWAVA